MIFKVIIITDVNVLIINAINTSIINLIFSSKSVKSSENISIPDSIIDSELINFSDITYLFLREFQSDQ